MYAACSVCEQVLTPSDMSKRLHVNIVFILVDSCRLPIASSIMSYVKEEGMHRMTADNIHSV